MRDWKIFLICLSYFKNSSNGPVSNSLKSVSIYFNGVSFKEYNF
ncbi:hypothetical protein CoNPh26_CDS0116 [Staphylococcus phage S-CoN_Ph26]|nr:hypothetical protein CoNPh26_CDS0116 [Staphylococcus phage S-CoN_Ph26]